MELNFTRKGKQEELQRPGSNGGGPRRIRKISPQQRQERKFQIKTDTKHRPAHTQHTQELNELQIAQHLHHLTTTHLQLSGTCFSLTQQQNALHQQPLFYHMCCCECGAS